MKKKVFTMAVPSDSARKSEVEIKDVGVLPAAKLNPEERSEQRNEDATSMLVRSHD